MWAILMGWSAAAGVVDWTMALPMYAGGIAWGVAYDCIYAHQVRRRSLISVSGVPPSDPPATICSGHLLLSRSHQDPCLPIRDCTFRRCDFLSLGPVDISPGALGTD